MRFHEQDAGRATCGSKARYSSGTYGSHCLKSRRKLGFRKKINDLITKVRIFRKIITGEQQFRDDNDGASSLHQLWVQISLQPSRNLKK